MSYWFHPAAEAEHLHTVHYYESKNAGLGAEYLADFEAAITMLIDQPRMFSVEMAPDIRRASLPKFPFNVLYRECDAVFRSWRSPTSAGVPAFGRTVRSRNVCQRLSIPRNGMSRAPAKHS